jgi:DNA-binding GntR family transcriptional regulator
MPGSDGRPTSQSQDAYDTIKNAILRWELAPGEQVTELQLTTSFGYGRAAIRAALTRLSHEQLVQAIPRQGYAVAPITFKLVQDLFGLRLIVECAAARLAAERTDDEYLAELVRLNEACQHRSGQENITELRDANRVFHIALVAGAGNDLLTATATNALDGMQRVLYLPQVVNVWKTIDATYDDHTAIIDALHAHDPGAAERATADHIESNRDFFISALISSPAFREIDLLRVG